MQIQNLRLFGMLTFGALVPVGCALDTGPEDGGAGKGAASGAAGSTHAGSSSGGSAAGQAGSAGKGGSDSGGRGGMTGTGGAQGGGAGRAGSAGTGGFETSSGGSGGSGGSSGRGGASSGGTAGSDASGGTDSGGAGGEPGTGEGGSGSEEIPAGYVKGIIGVGYGGLRIVSRDGGLTWGSRSYAAPDGGDDDDLLRAVAYGKGRWIATGWKLMTSDDGIEWTDHGKLNQGIIDGEQIVEGLAYKDGNFYAAGDGDPSKIFRSSDGIEWERIGSGGDTVKHTGLAYRGGYFVSYGDSHTSYRSANALDWTEMDGLVDATFCENEWRSLEDCHDAEWFDAGFYLIPEWGGDIRRSTTGENFQNVYSDDQENTLYRARALAEGYVAPE